MFRTVPLSIFRSFSLYTQQFYVIQVCGTFCEQDQDGSVLILLASCMTFTIAVCTVKKLLMMDRGTVRNMYSFIPKINLKN